MSDHASLDSQLAHARETGDAAAEAQCLMQWAIVADKELAENQPEEHTLAAGLYAQAAQAFERAGDVEGQAEALTALADNLARLDSAEMERMAHHLYEDVFSLYTHLDDRAAQARILLKIPDVTWRLDEQNREVFYTRALVFMDQFSDPVERADLLVTLAETMVGWPSYKEALPTFEKALRLYEAAHAHSRQADTVRRLGQITDDDELALSYRMQAAEIYERIGDLTSAGIVWGEIGTNALSPASDQIPAYVHAVELLRQTGSTFYEATILHTLGGLTLKAENLVDSQIYLERALALFQRHAATDSQQVAVLKQLGVLSRALNDIERYRVYYAQALALIQRTQSRAHFLWEWGMVEHDLGNHDQALQHFQQAIEHHRHIHAEFTPFIITEWKNELMQLGYQLPADFEDAHDDH